MQALDSVNEDGPIFGVPIELLLNRKDNDSMVIPKIIATCIEWLKSNGGYSGVLNVLFIMKLRKWTVYFYLINAPVKILWTKRSSLTKKANM